MSSQPPQVSSFESRVHLTRRRMVATRRHIHRIETAKELVCGIPSPEAVAKLRRDFEDLLVLLEEGCRFLNSGWLDTLDDRGLRKVLSGMQERDSKMSAIHEGALRIGLPAIEPFPHLLSRFKMYQEKMQSQMEGVLLSLNGSFQELLEKSAREVTVTA